MKEVKEKNFEELVVNSALPVLLDFYARWCGPCQNLYPKLEKLEIEYKGRISFFKVDIDSSQEIANKYKVRGIPAILILDRGKVKLFEVGDKPEKELRGKLEEVLSLR